MMLDQSSQQLVAAGSQIQPIFVDESFDDGENKVIHAMDRAMPKSKQIHPDERALIDALRHRPFIIRRRSNTREYWDYVVMTLAIYNCIWTPLTVSFDWAKEMDTNNIYLTTFDTIILALYTIDIVIQFMTSYYNI